MVELALQRRIELRGTQWNLTDLGRTPQNSADIDGGKCRLADLSRTRWCSADRVGALQSSVELSGALFMHNTYFIIYFLIFFVFSEFIVGRSVHFYSCSSHYGMNNNHGQKDDKREFTFTIFSKFCYPI